MYSRTMGSQSSRCEAAAGPYLWVQPAVSLGAYSRHIQTIETWLTTNTIKAE